MIKRFIGFFEYYAIHHLKLNVPAVALRDDQAQMLGYVEEIRIQRENLHISGWAIAETIEIRLGDYTWIGSPSIERGDVFAQLGRGEYSGFRLQLPHMSARKLDMTLTADGQKVDLQLDLPGPKEWAKARRRLWTRYVGLLLKLAPRIIIGILREEPDLRYRIKAALDLVERKGHQTLDPRILCPAPGLGDPKETACVTVVVPVHNAFQSVQECLRRVADHTDINWRLVLVEDASTDRRIRPWLREWARFRQDEGRQVLLVENDENLGFIRSVNKALEVAREWPDPVVLLNSDAMVPEGWASRLLAPIWRDGENVASVTPMSNDAEIFSAPIICYPTELADGQVDHIDAAARALDCSDLSVSAPTGVGFCMALNPVHLDRLPTLDVAFGRGYGEEVDWCRKAAALGGTHHVAANLFVEHRGGQSFGSEAKKMLVARNNAEIERRYPSYDASVQEFILRDPLLTVRMALAVAYIDTLPDTAEVPVYIAHTMGGGAEFYLQSRIADLNPKVAIILRFGGATRCQIEVTTPNGTIMGATNDLEAVEVLVGRLKRRRVVYSCAVGDRDPVELPDFIVRLAEGKTLEVLFHDYFPLSPSYTLLDQDRVYRGVPIPGHADAAHRSRRANGGVISLSEWRDVWGKMMERADRLVVFSRASLAIVEKAYPSSSEKLIVRPHTLHKKVERLTPPAKKDRVVIGVPGNIGPQKGAAVVQALSRLIEGDKTMELVILGKLDPSFRLGPKTRYHGRYNMEDFAFLAKKYEVDVWFIPSIWPETFSYTTHECLSTSLPVISFDIGAQGEAVSCAENGHIVKLLGREAEKKQLAAAVAKTARQIIGGARHSAEAAVKL